MTEARGAGHAAGGRGSPRRSSCAGSTNVSASSTPTATSTCIVPAGDDPRHRRRERRRQVDPDEHPLRVLPGRQRQILVDGQDRRIQGPQDAIKAGIGMVHQHFMLVEPFTCSRTCCSAPRAAYLAGGAVRARAESRRSSATTAGGRLDARSATCRSACSSGSRSSRPVPRRAHPDPGRADRRADPAGGRGSVPHPAQAEGTGPHRHPDHPQAARDHGRHRQCRGHARRARGGVPAHRGDTRGAGRADGRPPCAAAGREGAGAAGARRCSRCGTSRSATRAACRGSRV